MGLQRQNNFLQITLGNYKEQDLNSSSLTPKATFFNHDITLWGRNKINISQYPLSVPNFNNYTR